MSDITQSFGLRISVRFLNRRFDLFEEQLKRCPTVRLQNLCRKEIRRGVQPIEDDTGDVIVVKTMQLKNGYLNLSEAGKVTEDFLLRFSRARIITDDVLISSTGEGRGKIDVYDRDDVAIADSHISIVPMRDSADALLIAAFLRSPFGRHQLERLEMAVKSTPELYADEIGLIRIPSFSKDEKVRLTSRIREIQAAAMAERSRLKSPEDVINETLCRELGYPLREHIERARAKQYIVCFSANADGYSLRNSPRFHHPHFALTQKFFAETIHEPVKAFVSVPIRLGATATKNDFVENGEAFYVHPAATKNQRVIVLEDCHRITEQLYKARRRFKLVKEDIVLNRSGEGTIGKSGLFDSDAQALFADFTMRIRFNPDRMLARFGWYYLRSVMFQSQVEREKRGMGNMTNIFPSQVERMLVPLCATSMQAALVREIEAELSQLDRARAAIDKKREDVAEVIDSAVRNVIGEWQPVP